MEQLAAWEGQQKYKVPGNTLKKKCASLCAS